MKFAALLTALLVNLGSTSDPKPIHVEINQNVESIGICFGLAKNGFSSFPKDYYEPFRTQAQQHFYPHKDHQAVKMVEEFVKQGFWLDKLMFIALHASSVPQAEIVHELDSTLYRAASKNKDVEEGKETIEEFIQALNDFYEQAHVEKFMEVNQRYYQKVLQEVKANLPSSDFIPTMERYYGTEQHSYTLIPSPMMYRSAAIGPRVKTPEGLAVFNVFGPIVLTNDSSEFGYGYHDAKKIHELSVHEFGHSFVNPTLATPENKEIIDQNKHLFQPIQEEMKRQGYRNWNQCLTEHIVRLGEIRIAYAMNADETAERLRQDYVEERKFIYIPPLEENIKIYEEHRSQYASFEQYVPSLLRVFNEIDVPEK